MNALLRRVIAERFAPLQRRLAGLARQAVLILVAIATLVVAIGFLTAAGCCALAASLGVTWALLIVAAIYIVVALFLAILALTSGRTAGATAPPPRAAPALEDLLAGATTDDAALLAGIRLFGGLKPYELVGLAILAGFLVGRRGPRT